MLALTAVVFPLAVASPAAGEEKLPEDAATMVDQFVPELTDDSSLDSATRSQGRQPESAGESLSAPDTVWTPPSDLEPVDHDPNFPDEDWAVGAERFQALREETGSELRQRQAPRGTPVGAPGIGEMPWFGFHDFELSPDSSAHVNLANGNLLVKANDFDIAGPGYALRHDRFYNSLSDRLGSIGGGWHSNNGTFDVGIHADGTAAIYRAPNGVTLTFDRVGSTSEFTAPAGSNMTLVEDTASSDARYVVTHNRSGDRLEFNERGHLAATYDRNGVGETYGYNSASMISSATHTSGRALFFDMDTKTIGIGVEDSVGREVTYSHVGFNLTEVTSIDGQSTKYGYNSDGMLASIELPSAASPTVVSFEYDDSYRITKVTQDQSGTATTFAYGSGETVVTDANGHESTFTVDAEGRVTSSTDALDRTRSQTWTANSDIESTTDAIGTNTITYTYDGSGNQTSAELPTGAAASAVYEIGADCSAPDTGTAFQPKCSTDDAGNEKQHEYDAAGNVTKQTDTSGSTPVVEFERSYDGCDGFDGQVCSTTDGEGNVTTYDYNARGDLTRVTPPAPMGETTYTYDALGRVTSVTDGNGDTTGYQYDVRDRLVFTTFDNGQSLLSTYYPNGLEHKRTDSATGSITYTYDRQGRILTQVGPEVGVTHSYTYDAVGNMLSFADSGGTTNYTYDAANQLTALTQPGGTCPASGTPAGYSGCVMFEYDDNGAETKRILPRGANTVTARDDAGRATRITAKAGLGTTMVDIGYDYTAPASGEDRVNIQARTAHVEQGITPGATTTYTYDSRNRLTNAEETADDTVSASWSYEYDDNDNRTQQVRTGDTGAAAGTIDYDYNAANQLVSSTDQATTWTYDDAGNQTRRGSGTNTTYGDRQQVTAIGSSAHTNFGVGNTDRIAVTGLRFENGALGLMRRTNDTNTDHRYTRTPDGQAVAARYINDVDFYYVHDHLGSVVGLMDGNGNFRGGYSYSPYGEERASTSYNNHLQYIGELNIGADYYKLGARYYDVNQGRFTQMDPSGQEGNPYAYVPYNPVNATDPSGLAQNCFAQAGQIVFYTAGLLSSAPSIVGIAFTLPAYYDFMTSVPTNERGYAVCEM